MRAWQTTQAGRPTEALVLNDEVTSPEPYEGSIRLDVLVAGIGLPDALMCQGSYALTPVMPFTQGQEVVGRISALGPGVENRAIGDRVMAVSCFFSGHGSFAEQCLVMDDFCLPVPDEMTDAEAAAFLIPLHTAYVGLCERARLEAGETLLVSIWSLPISEASINDVSVTDIGNISTLPGPEAGKRTSSRPLHTAHFN